MNEELKIQIIEIWPVSREVYALGGIGISWISNGIGWGEISLYFTPDGKLHADTEHMCSDEDRAFIKAVLEKLAEEVIIDG